MTPTISTPAAPVPQAHSRFRRAFSLVEVLLAIFILGIGMIMVASVFPVGANWTRQAAEESVGQIVARSAESVIRTRYGPNGDLRRFLASDFYIPNAGFKTPLLDPNPPLSFWNPNPSVFSPTPPLPPPVGNWNTILQSPNIATGTFIPINPFVLQALPGFGYITPYERGYLFGSATPFPVPADKIDSCTYFWTALARLNPGHRVADVGTDGRNGVAPSSSYTYDVYILVFRKGSAEQQFSYSPTDWGVTSEVRGTRDFDFDGFVSGPELILPSVYYVQYNFGSHDPSQTPSVYGAVPAMGQYGIGAYSGTVFKQVLDTRPSVDLSVAGPGGAFPRPMIINNPDFEYIIAAPPADGTNSSPLIYIYQTTITF